MRIRTFSSLNTNSIIIYGNETISNSYLFTNINVNTIGSAVEDFTANFGGSDAAALGKYLSDMKLQPAATYREGFQATVLAIKACEAVAKGAKVALVGEGLEAA